MINRPGRPRTITQPGQPPSEGRPKFQVRVDRNLHDRVVEQGGTEFVREAIENKLLFGYLYDRSRTPETRLAIEALVGRNQDLLLKLAFDFLQFLHERPDDTENAACFDKYEEALWYDYTIPADRVTNIDSLYELCEWSVHCAANYFAFGREQTDIPERAGRAAKRIHSRISERRRPSTDWRDHALQVAFKLCSATEKRQNVVESDEICRDASKMLADLQKVAPRAGQGQA